jgi:cation transport ATPase
MVVQIAGTTTVISSQDMKEQVSERNFFIFRTSHVISTQKTESVTSPESPSQWKITVKVTRFSPLILLFFAILYGWFYAVGVNMNKKLPGTVKMTLTKFKWFLFISFAGMSLLYLFSYSVYFKLISNEIVLNFGITAAIITLYLFSLFCFFYCIYFIAKSFQAVELQQPVTFSDYLWMFFLIVFFPIGVWLIQPRINKIFSETT